MPFNARCNALDTGSQAMMRRQFAPAAAAGARGITSYNFGQGDMDTEFLAKNLYIPRKDAVASPVRVSKLPNGVRIVTHDRQGPHISVGAFIEAGAKFDPITTPGLSYVMRWALSGANMENSLFQLDRNARSVGAAREHCEVRKRFIGLKFEAPVGAHWERLAWDIFTSVSAPRLPEWDTERFRDTMDNLREEKRWQDPREYAIDELETVAYYREPLGNPRMVPPELNNLSTHAAMLAQWARCCVPSRVVIAGVNIDHDALVAAYENAPFPHSADAPHHANSSRPVLPAGSEELQFAEGGERTEQEGRGKAMGTKPDMEDEAIVAVGFSAHGADTNTKGYAASLVARELAAITFGEASAINRDAPHHGVESFYRPFADTGLIGATIRCPPAETQSLTVDTVKALRGLSSSDSAITAAKARAASRFYAENLEVTRDYVDFLGTNLQGDTLHRLSLDDILAAIDGVDGAAIKKLGANFAKRPAMFAHGECVGLPSLRQMGL